MSVNTGMLADCTKTRASVCLWVVCEAGAALDEQRADLAPARLY